MQDRWNFYYSPVAVRDKITFTNDEDVISYFTEGQCGALAYELHKLTGWSLVAITDGPIDSLDYSGHVFVVNSDGLAVDIKGVRTIDEVKEDWYFCHYLHRFFSHGEFDSIMSTWDFRPAYSEDPEARLWARTILNLLDW